MKAIMKTIYDAPFYVIMISQLTYFLAANNDDAEYMFNVLRELDDEIDIVMNDNIGDANVDVNDPY